MEEENIYVSNEAKNVLKYIKNKPFSPVQLDLLLTTKCNLKCKFCKFSIDENQIMDKDELKDEEIFRVVDEGLKLGVKSWYIEGGEPLVKKSRLFTILEKIKNKKRNGNLASNGTLFDDESIKKIVDIQWDEITFSLDSTEPKTHDYLRGKNGTFNRLITNIKKIQEYKKTQSFEKPLLNFHSVITNKNYNKLDSIILLASELGIKNVNFTHVWKETELFEDLTLSDSQKEVFESNVNKALKLANKLNIRTNLQGYLRVVKLENLGNLDKLLETKSEKADKLSSIACYEPFTKIIIGANGDASCCSFFCEISGVLFDNVRVKSLKEIWESNQLKMIRDGMITKNIPEKCKKCPTTLIIHNEKLRDHLVKFTKNG